jgi:hypothetical protein
MGTGMAFEGGDTLGAQIDLAANAAVDSGVRSIPFKLNHY